MLGSHVLDLMQVMRERGTPLRFQLTDTGVRVRLLRCSPGLMPWTTPGQEYSIAWWWHPATSAQIRDALSDLVHPFRPPRVLRKDQR